MKSMNFTSHNWNRSRNSLLLHENVRERCTWVAMRGKRASLVVQNLTTLRKQANDWRGSASRSILIELVAALMFEHCLVHYVIAFRLHLNWILNTAYYCPCWLLSHWCYCGKNLISFISNLIHFHRTLVTQDCWHCLQFNGKISWKNVFLIFLKIVVIKHPRFQEFILYVESLYSSIVMNGHVCRWWCKQAQISSPKCTASSETKTTTQLKIVAEKQEIWNEIYSMNYLWLHTN